MGDATSCLPAVDQERAGVVLLVGIFELIEEPEEEGGLLRNRLVRPLGELVMDHLTRLVW